MANAVLGDVAVRLGTETFTLRLDMNAYCELEAETGQLAREVIATVGDAQMRSMWLQRVLAWAALQRHHPGTTLSRRPTSWSATRRPSGTPSGAPWAPRSLRVTRRAGTARETRCPAGRTAQRTELGRDAGRLRVGRLRGGGFLGADPRMWLLQLETSARHEKRRHEAAITAAWLTVRLSRAAKLPPLNRLLKASAATGAGDPAAQLAALKTGLPRITLEEWKARHG